jgi:hypothetical protein
MGTGVLKECALEEEKNERVPERGPVSESDRAGVAFLVALDVKPWCLWASNV